MKKWIHLIAIALAVVMLAGCNLIAVDEELNAKMTVLEIGGEPVTKAQLYNTWASAMDQTASMYQMYGMSFDASSITTRQGVLDQAITSLITQRVVQQKGKALGLDQFTEEELAEMEPEVQGDMDYYASYVQSQYFADTALEGDALTEAVNARMEELGLTREVVLDSVKTAKVSDRVRAETIKDVAVTPEEVAAEYQSKVDTQKATYTETLTSYGSDVRNGQTIYYVPAGYRYVKHVLLKIDSAASSALTALQSELDTLTTTRANLEDSLNGLQGQGDELSEEEETARALSEEQLRTQMADIDVNIAAKQTELDSARADAFAALMPRVEEVQSKIALGLNFDKVIESYGEDAGMTSEPSKTQGYPVTEGLTVYDQAFQDAAMALGRVGDVSEPVQSSFGYHIIKYVGDSVEHEIGLDAVSEDLSATMLSTKQDEAYSAAQEQWISDTKVKRYDNRIDFI